MYSGGYGMTRATLLSLIEKQRTAPRRDHPLSLRLNGGELRRLKTAAKRHGIPAATLARLLLVAGLEDLEGERKESE